MGQVGWPNNLPEALTSFVGRAREREQARDALGSTRLLTLTGAGGAGKTRLALQVAADVSDSFPDGGWWLELAPLVDRESVDGELTGVLGVRPLPGRTEVQAAVDRLSGDRALVVLDNCEHLREAAADLAEALLRGCPRVVVLATSREPLGVPGESDWRVPSLSPSEAAALFAARAVKVRPDFAVGDGNAPMIARICRELDGIPLAIELASARVRMLSLEQIAEGLSDRFRLLTGGPRTADPRQHTLRASVDWSYELLSEDERLLFRRLATFAGGWSLEAVESVCAGDGLDDEAILDLLTSLVDKSLVAVEGQDRVFRYGMLETVRQYAVQLHEQSGEHRALRRRHLDFFVALAERAAAGLNLPLDRGWLDALELEAANLGSAINYGVESHPELALRIGVALTPWWEAAGRFAFGENALARSLDAADPSPSRLRARALWSRGYLARYLGDWQAADDLAQEALAMAESIGDEPTMARVLHTLGAMRMFQDPVANRPPLSRSADLARSAGDTWALMAATTAVAFSYLITDDYADAERLLEQLAPGSELTGPQGVTWTGSLLGWCAMSRAEHERCFELCGQTLAAVRELGDPMTEAFAHGVLARDETMQGRPQAARDRSLASEARAIARGAGMALPMARTELAWAEAGLGKLHQARELLDVVVTGGADTGWMLCRALVALADVLRVLGDEDGALVRTREALELSERLGARSLSATGRELLARLAVNRSEWSEAESLAHQALAQRLEVGATAWLPQSLDPLAQIAVGCESYAEAARLLGAAERARSDLGLARWAPDAPAFEDLERMLSDELGAEAFAAAHAEGAAMPLDEAIGWVRRARGTRKRPSSGWESLTPTEVRVVALVAQGLTNPQVAERMFISRATVKAHLAHIFQKLNVGSRSELAATAVRRGG